MAHLHNWSNIRTKYKVLIRTFIVQNILKSGSFKFCFIFYLCLCTLFMLLFCFVWNFMFLFKMFVVCVCFLQNVWNKIYFNPFAVLFLQIKWNMNKCMMLMFTIFTVSVGLAHVFGCVWRFRKKKNGERFLFVMCSFAVYYNKW